MSISVQDYLRDQAEEALAKKSVTEPCPRCKYDYFYIFEVGTTDTVLVACKRCGYKIEHLFSILLEETDSSNEEETK